MRAITVTFYVNDGTGVLGSSNNVSAELADMGEFSWSLDDQLTKVTPGDLNVTVFDEDGSVWTWFDTQVSTTYNSKSQLFPPWVVVTVAGATIFTGVVDLASVRRNLKEYTLEISAKDWSVMLRDISLDGPEWLRPKPKTPSSRTGAGPYNIFVIAGIIAGLTTSGQFAEASTTLQLGDSVLVDGSLSSKITWLAIGNNGAPLFKLDPLPSPGNHTLTRPTATLGDSPFYSVLASVSSEGFVVKLDTVESLVPGDVLMTVGKNEIRVDDIDTERKEIISAVPIGSDLVNGDKLYFTQETTETLVWQDGVQMIEKALAPYYFGVDATNRLFPLTVAYPILSWLPLSVSGVSVGGPHDIEPTLTQLRVIGSGSSAYTGTPEAGWTTGTATTRFVPWTNLASAAPAYLMPDTTPAVAWEIGERTRVYTTWRNTRARTKDDNWNPQEPTHPDSGRDYAFDVLCHDYTYFRRIRIHNPVSGTGTLYESRWNGSAWSGETSVAWPAGGTWTPVAACPMIGTTATAGPVAPQGLAILALAQNRSGAYELQLAFASGGLQRLSVPNTMAGARLVTTPWGVWLVGKGGYARVTTNGSALSMTNWAYGNVRGSGCVLIPSTFAALDTGSVYCLGVLVAKDPNADPAAKTPDITETHLFNLMSTPLADTNPIIHSEKIISGSPRLAVAVKDPSQAGRIIGIVGGRFFQISATLPRTIERIRVTGMTGAEMVEYIAQALNALVIPQPSGFLQLVSRSVPSGSATPVTVDRVTVTQQRISENFFGVVRVTGANDDIYQDAYGAVNGGRALEIDSQPCVWTEGGAYSIASSYAAFFGYPRKKETHSWFHDNPNTAPPWEALVPWQWITVPGSSSNWFLTGLSSNLITGEAEATLLEKV